MTSLVEVATHLPPRVPLTTHGPVIGLTQVETRRYRRGFGFEHICWDPELSETDLMLAAAAGLAGLRGREHQVRYLIRARTVRFPSPYPRSPLDDVRRALGLRQAQAFAVTEHACASGLLAVDLAGTLLDTDPLPDALALVLLGEKAFSKPAQLMPGVAVMGEAASAVLVSAEGAGDRVMSFTTRTVPLPNTGPCLNSDQYAMFGDIYPPALADVVKSAVASAGITLDDLALILPHNVNALSWVKTVKRLGLPLERVFLDNLPRMGHCFTADPFLNYRTVTESRLMRPGDYYAMTSVGLGATFSAMVLQH
ncbi:MAG TPA: 3-oxoacyl-[acyl-carrier-protein] synthase III C-terminal domain-containing protein [Kineosporiaceae bacterium]